jgi:hypothetical protein
MNKEQETMNEKQVIKKETHLPSNILFEEDGKDDYGYPITSYNSNGDPIVKEVEKIKKPQLLTTKFSFDHLLNRWRSLWIWIAKT